MSVRYKINNPDGRCTPPRSLGYFGRLDNKLATTTTGGADPRWQQRRVVDQFARRRLLLAWIDQVA
jgi:hypothetical protein